MKISMREVKAIALLMQCNECGKKFKKAIGKWTMEAKCPKCGGYDTEPIY